MTPLAFRYLASHRERRPAPPRGMALMTVLILLLVVTLLGVVAIKGTNVGVLISGVQKQKKSLHLVAESAQQIIARRIYERMNPVFYVKNPDYDASAAPGTPNSQKQLPVSVSELVTAQYKFQTGATAEASLDAYIADFAAIDYVNDASAHTGVFAPCAGGCATTEGAEWKVTHFESLPLPVNHGIKSRGGNKEDPVRRLRITVEATDPSSDRRATITREVLLGIPQSIDSMFPVYAEVISRYSLLNGYIKGAVVQYWDQKLAWGSNALFGPTTTNFDQFYLGTFGQVHPGCQGAKYQPGICPASAATANVPVNLESAYQAQFMTTWGILTNGPIAATLGAHSAPFDPNTAGMIVDDLNTFSTTPNDILDLTQVSPPYVPLPFTFGQDRYGGIPAGNPDNPASDLGTLAVKLNTLSTGSIATLTQSHAVGDDGCIYRSDFKTTLVPNSGLGAPIPSTTSMPNNGYDDSLILAPRQNGQPLFTGTIAGGNCSINVEGLYTVKGDVIIAGSADGTFSGKGAIRATGNIYILNNVNLANRPDISAVDEPDYRFSTDGNVLNYHRLALIADGHIIIGNLTNSHAYAFIMTAANQEIPHYRIDMNGDQDPEKDPDVGSAGDNYDLLVPDGFRSTSTTPTRPTTQFQVGLMPDCTNVNANFHMNCASMSPGILPERSDAIVNDAYRFMFADKTAGAVPPNKHRSAYGYTRNGANLPPGYKWRSPLLTVAALNQVCRPGMPAGPVGPYNTCMDSAAEQSGPLHGANSDLFTNGWITTGSFRSFANMTAGAEHDSLEINNLGRVREIDAKLFANGAIVGVASFDDKYTKAAAFAFTNPALGSQASYGGKKWDVALVDDGEVTINGCHAHSGALTIVGGLYARYVNILSTEGLCIYPDDRPGELMHQPIYVIPGDAYYEDPAVVANGM